MLMTEGNYWTGARDIFHFIGICGAGKTTLASRLAKRCERFGGKAIGTLDYDPHTPDHDRGDERAFSRDLDRLNNEAVQSDPAIHQQIVKHSLAMIERWKASDANAVFVDRWYERIRPATGPRNGGRSAAGNPRRSERPCGNLAVVCRVAGGGLTPGKDMNMKQGNDMDIGEFGERFLTAALKSVAMGAIAAILWPWLWFLWVEHESYQFALAMAASTENRPGPPIWSYIVIAVVMTGGMFWADWHTSRKTR